jgi:hypothetical protein
MTPSTTSGVRNPSNGGFSIPLLEKGDSRNFYPDFLVWKDGVVFALDPKGGHLIGKDDADLKLLDIRDEKGAPHYRQVDYRWTMGRPEDEDEPEGLFSRLLCTRHDRNRK